MRFRNLERYRTGGHGNHMELSVPLPQTPDGKIVRVCPDKACMPGVFQLGDPAEPRPDDRVHRRARQPGMPGTTCPYCGAEADDGEFTSPEDIQAALREIKWAVGRDARDFLRGLAGDFNRRTSRKPFLQIRMDVKGGHRSRPRVYREDLLRGLNCDACGRRYGVFAVGLFCPDCGAPNLLTHFTREVELISQQIALADAARDNGRRELAFRLLGNAHEDVLTAFETYLKTAHRQLARRVDLTDPCAKRVKTNRFQNISRTREAFAELGVDPFAALDHSALAFLRLNVEKRHVVGHNLGIVDEHFAEAAEEEQPGRTVILLAEEIARFAELCHRIIAAIDDLLLSAPTPASAAPDATTDSPPANGGDDERAEL